MNRFARLPLIAGVLLLASCTRDHAPSGPYAKWLKNGEHVESTEQVGPFTILHVSYRPSGWGSFHGTGRDFDRVLHAAKIVIDESQISKPWDETGAPAILSYVYADGERPLNVVFERNGKPVAKRIDVGTGGLTVGEAVGPGLRYFDGQSNTQSGSLLKAFPLQVIAIPRGIDRPGISYFAGFAPDFKAFALTDSPSAPSVVIVADSQGKLGEPIPVPPAPAVSREVSGARPSEFSRAWFDSRFTWQKNAAGRWDIVRTAANASGAELANPVEELFLDAGVGYRNCFASGAAACLRGWQRVKAESKAMQELFCCETPYFYKPLQPARAFGAPVRSLLYASANDGSAYHLILNAPPEQVMRELRAGIGSRGLKHLTHEQITEQALTDFVGQDFYRINCLLPQEGDKGGQRIVLPTVALRIEPFEQGTIIYTLARYPALAGAGDAK